jgi:hypothetical protein
VTQEKEEHIAKEVFSVMLDTFSFGSSPSRFLRVRQSGTTSSMVNVTNQYGGELDAGFT